MLTLAANNPQPFTRFFGGSRSPAMVLKNATSFFVIGRQNAALRITRHGSQLSPSNQRMNSVSMAWTMSNRDSACRKRLRGGCLGSCFRVMPNLRDVIGGEAIELAIPSKPDSLRAVFDREQSALVHRAADVGLGPSLAE